jgi:exonuclease SbcD
MRVLHTSDWHIGRTIRGRSRADEFIAVLAEIAAVAVTEAVDLILVVGDIFDTAAPTAEAEQIAYRALLDLAATGATVVVVSGNHDSERRLQAIAPLLSLGRIVTRATFAAAADGGVVSGQTTVGEPWRVAVVPFLSQRWVVRAADLMGADAGDHSQQYASRVVRIVHSLTAGFDGAAVNLVAAHLHVAGGVVGGGERLAHTIFAYAVPATAFPASAHYVALGHLHRPQQIAGPCPIRYCGSPLALDFSETEYAKSVTIIDASPGAPARTREVPLHAGRRLRVLRGTLVDLMAATPTVGDDWLKVVVSETPRIGLADEVRSHLPNAVDVIVEDPALAGGAPAGDKAVASRQGRSPHDLFAEYLSDRHESDSRLLALFDRLLDEAADSGDKINPDEWAVAAAEPGAQGKAGAKGGGSATGVVSGETASDAGPGETGAGERAGAATGVGAGEKARGAGTARRVAP